MSPVGEIMRCRYAGPRPTRPGSRPRATTPSRRGGRASRATKRTAPTRTTRVRAGCRAYRAVAARAHAATQRDLEESQTARGRIAMTLVGGPPAEPMEHRGTMGGQRLRGGARARSHVRRGRDARAPCAPHANAADSRNHPPRPRPCATDRRPASPARTSRVAPSRCGLAPVGGEHRAVPREELAQHRHHRMMNSRAPCRNAWRPPPPSRACPAGVR